MSPLKRSRTRAAAGAEPDSDFVPEFEDGAEAPGVDQKLSEIQGLLEQQQRRTTWLVIAVLLMAITNLDLIGSVLRTVLYGLLIVGILAGVYWFALQRGRQGRRV